MANRPRDLWHRSHLLSPPLRHGADQFLEDRPDLSLGVHAAGTDSRAANATASATAGNPRRSPYGRSPNFDAARTAGNHQSHERTGSTGIVEDESSLLGKAVWSARPPAKTYRCAKRCCGASILPRRLRCERQTRHGTGQRRSRQGCAPASPFCASGQSPSVRSANRFLRVVRPRSVAACVAPRSPALDS